MSTLQCSVLSCWTVPRHCCDFGSIRDEEDRFTTNLAMVFSGEDVSRLVDVVADVVVVVVVDVDVFV